MTHRIVFFGTHAFAATILAGLVACPLFDVALVVTQPDKPVGRKKVLTPPPVKVFAQAHGIPVHQPVSLKKDTTDYSTFDLAVVAQYGKIIPEHIVNAPTHGTLNTHTSLLPKYRGASPIQTALMHGELHTGVTIMKMDAGMDTGPVLLQKHVDIYPDETYGELDARLAPVARDALIEAIPAYVSGTRIPQPQDDHAATACRLLTREDGRVDWKKSAQDVYNQYRGLTPWPGIWTEISGKRLKLLEIRPSTVHYAPGTFHRKGHRLFMGCKDGSIEVFRLQLEGKEPMDAQTFLNGFASLIC